MDDEKTMTETAGNSKWHQIGEMSLKDAVRICGKYISGIRLKDIGVYSMSVVAFLISGLFLYYGLVPVCKFIWHVIWRSLSMTIGMHEDAYSYALFDSDLLCTVPLCILVAAAVGYCSRNCRFLFALCYFVLFQATLEFWDYLYIEMPGLNGILGGICFTVMFVVIPVLRYMGKEERMPPLSF